MLQRLTSLNLRTVHWRVLLGGALLTLLPSFAQVTTAAVIEVDTTDDVIASNLECSLREAITAANTDTAFDTCAAGSGADTIVLTVDAGIFAIEIAGSNEDANMTGDFDILDDLVIEVAPGIDPPLVDAQLHDRVFEVHDGVDLTIDGFEVRGGDVIGFGGCILTLQQESALTVRNATVRNCTASLFGGGVFAVGRFDLIDSVLTANTAVNGGNVYKSERFSDHFTATRSEISAGVAYADGGGIYTESVALLLHSRLSGNHADGDGGGLYQAERSVVGGWASEIEFNTAGGSGGGYYVQQAQIDTTTFRGNSSGGNGGAIFYVDDNGAGNRLRNCTVTENGADGFGGGLYLEGFAVVELFNATIAANAANVDGIGGEYGGGFSSELGRIRAQNSVIASNLALSDDRGLLEPDCDGELHSIGYNFIGRDGPNCDRTGPQVGDWVGISQSIDPMLACAADNGGETHTMAQLPGSPLADSGDPAGCASNAMQIFTEDQRGYPRPWDSDDPGTEPRCDIGAYEAFAPHPSYIFIDGFESGDTSAWTTGRSVTRYMLHQVDRSVAGPLATRSTWTPPCG